MIHTTSKSSFHRFNIITVLCFYFGFIFTDASYSDPLGPQMERPKTAAARKQDNDDLFDEDVGDDLLPE